MSVHVPARCKMASISAVKRLYRVMMPLAARSCSGVAASLGRTKRPSACAARSTSSGTQSSNSATASAKPGSRSLRNPRALHFRVEARYFPTLL